MKLELTYEELKRLNPKDDLIITVHTLVRGGDHFDISHIQAVRPDNLQPEFPGLKFKMVECHICGMKTRVRLTSSRTLCDIHLKEQRRAAMIEARSKRLIKM